MRSDKRSETKARTVINLTGEANRVKHTDMVRRYTGRNEILCDMVDDEGHFYLVASKRQTYPKWINSNDPYCGRLEMQRIICNYNRIGSVSLERYMEYRKRISFCSICLESGSTTSTPCGHYYHNGCIAEWLKKNRTCPCCKNSLSPRQCSLSYTEYFDL